MGKAGEMAGMMDNADTVPAADDDTAPEQEASKSDLWKQVRSGQMEDDPDAPGTPPAPSAQDDDEDDFDPGDRDEDDDIDDDDDDLDDDDNAAADVDAQDVEKQIERLEHQIASDKGRISAHRSRVTERQAELERAKARLERLKTDTETAEARRAKIAELGDEYEDALKPLAEEITATGSRFDALVEDETQRVEQLEDEIATARSEEEAIFLKEHPDAPEIFKNYRDVFTAWIEDQPKKLRDIAARNTTISDGVEASLLMSHFKRALANAEDADKADDVDTSERTGGETQRSDPRRQSQRRGAMSTKSTPGRRATPEPDPMSEDKAAHWDWALKKLRKKA